MIRILTGAAVVATLAACTQPAQDGAANADSAALETQAQKFSYSAGVEIGQRLQTISDSLDLAALQMGLKHGVEGDEPKLSAEEMQAVKQQVYAEAAEKRKAERDAGATAALERGQKFLAENAGKDGVKVTESGLQYQILEAGEGNPPSPEDTVVVHYRGTLLDGTEFDSSYSRGQPAKFRLNAVIAGWTEGLQKIKPGGKAKLFIPAELAYGERGAGQAIGPNETLIFEVELVEVEPAAAQ